MATGGIFELITNDGKQDRMLMATALLNKRLLDIEQKRAANPDIRDPTPTLVDIERTHVLFMNAHFKPFCAIGYEYNKTTVQSGQAAFGAEVDFSIPQFGDFFHDMVVHLKLGAVEATNSAYWTAPALNPADGSELLAYVNYLGQRIINKVRFEVNGNPLDEYTDNVMNFNQKFFITPNKTTGWKRAMGQEVPKQGFQNMYFANTRYGRGAGVRQEVSILDGPQTPKMRQPALGESLIEMWIPLLFWFNKDVRLAIPSVSIPYGQRFIKIKFAQSNEVLQHLHAFDPALDSPGTNTVPVPDITTCELYINNIFVNPEIHDIFIKRIGFSLIRVHREQKIRCQKSDDNLLLNQMKWPIETMYFGMRPADNIDVTSSHMLENWDLYCQVQDANVDTCALRDFPQQALPFAALTNAGLDTGLGIPGARTGAGALLATIEVITGALAAAAPTVANLNLWLGYYNYPLLNPANFVDPAAPTLLELNARWPGLITAGHPHCGIRYKTMIPTIFQLELSAHGIPLYREIPTTFFNSYVPYTYGGTHINTPFDIGAYMLTFNLYPGVYQPSGHINISRAREFYMRYWSNTIGSTISNADLIIIGIAINFLLISDGSAVLRYST
jgi:hypothetical protein